MALIVTCPACTKRLQVPADLVGQGVQCPECKETFTATVDGPKSSAIGTHAPAPAPATPEWDRPPGKPKSRAGRRADEDDEEYEEDDRPRRRSSRRSRRSYAPHRGGMILAFGLLAVVGVFSFVFGPMAWVMGNNDLREIREGRMDPDGESMTQTGRILGMIATILCIVGLIFICGIWAFFFLIVGAAAVGGAKNQPRRF